MKKFVYIWVIMDDEPRVERNGVVYADSIREANGIIQKAWATVGHPIRWTVYEVTNVARGEVSGTGEWRV